MPKSKARRKTRTGQRVKKDRRPWWKRLFGFFALPVIRRFILLVVVIVLLSWAVSWWGTLAW